MLVGHFAVGFVAKRAEPRLSLGTFILAAMFADFLWCIFLIAGIEDVQIQPGKGAENYIAAADIAFSHSLLMDVIWATLFAGAFFLWRRYRRGAWVLILVVLSHWVLDFVAHKPFMPLAPGLHKYLGLGLWTSVPATLIVEGGFWLLAIIIYARATHPKNRLGVYAFWPVTVLLTLAWYNNIAGPPPPDQHSAPFVSLTFFSLVVAWAYWMNRLRLTEKQVNSADSKAQAMKHGS